MSAIDWIENGATSAQSFGAYEGKVTLANVQGILYVELFDGVENVRQAETLDSKEILRMAHWIIKEFA